MGITNLDRAEYAQKALDNFVYNMDMESEEVETQLTDLLANLMHLCDVQGEDFSDILRIAEGHYSAEISEGPEAYRPDPDDLHAVVNYDEDPTE